jgi:hypothetical protein
VPGQNSRDVTVRKVVHPGQDHYDIIARTGPLRHDSRDRTVRRDRTVETCTCNFGGQNTGDKHIAREIHKNMT